MTERCGQMKLAAVAGGVAVVVLWNVVKKWRVRSGINKKIKWKQAQCKAAFAQVEQNLKNAKLAPEKVAEVVGLSFLELQQRLQDGTLTALDVLHAYQTVALEANKRVNAITEPLLDAEEIAARLDALTGEKQPLHGIPISVKENYDIAGLDSTAGLGQFLQNPKTQDAVLVQVLKDLGAVPFVRTNIPQTMMTYECSNPIFGESKNPYDLKRTPGGSTGGEGALIGSQASIIGIGSDIGGSIRIPSHLCGCYGLKTTLERLSRKGQCSLSKGQMQVSGTVGPLARDLDGLVAATKAILCDLQFRLDPKIPPLKFRDEIYEDKRPLRIGFYVDDGHIPAVPACQRAVRMAKQALEALGHTVVDFVPPRVKYVIPNLYIRSVQGDGGAMFNSYMNKDIEDPQIRPLLAPGRIPKSMLWVLAWTVKNVLRDKEVGEMMFARAGVKSVYEWFKHAIKLQEYKEEFLSVWRAQNLDAVICPPFATVAVPSGTVINILASGAYSWLYNVLNYPGGVLPVTRVTIDDVINLDKYPSNSPTQKNIKKYCKGSEGLPVGVQCVALPFQEELVLRVMRDIEEGLKALKK